MKRSTIIILSFSGLALILTYIYTVLVIKYTTEPHTINLYENFVVRFDSTTKQPRVYYKTNDVGYIEYSSFSNVEYKVMKFYIFEPTSENSLPVKFLDVKYKIIDGTTQQYLKSKPTDAIPPYLQETRYYTKQALLIESAIQIKYKNDTIIIEKSAQLPNTFTLLSEKIFLLASNTNYSRDSLIKFQGGLTTIINKDYNVSKVDLMKIINNKNTLSILKSNGDTIENYNKVTFNNFPGQKLTSNWFFSRRNMDNIKKMHFDNRFTFLYSKYPFPSEFPEEDRDKK